MDKREWIKFGFKVASKILEAIQEDIVPNTTNPFDDMAVGYIKTALVGLEERFVPDAVTNDGMKID